MLLNKSFEEIKSKTRMLNNYDVLVNEDEEVLICINLKIPGELEEGAFYYSGGYHGFLIKNHRSIVLCDYLNNETHDIIYKNEKILIVEVKEGKGILAEYEVPLIKVEGIDELAKRIIADKDKEE